MISFLTQSGTTIEVCEDLTNVCRFFEFPDDQVAIVNEHAKVDIRFDAGETEEFLGYLLKAAQNGVWPEIPNPIKLTWWTYLDMVDYFNLKQPFLDQAISKFFYRRCGSEQNLWCGSQGEPGILHEVWLDRVVDMGIKASKDRLAFPLTWAKFLKDVLSLAKYWNIGPEDRFQDARYSNTFEWMQLVRHSRWHELATPDMMTGISIALSKDPFIAVEHIPSDHSSYSVQAQLDIYDNERYNVQLGDAFMACVYEGRVMLVAQREVGVVEVSGTVTTTLRGSDAEETRLRFMYYPQKHRLDLTDIYNDWKDRFGLSRYIYIPKAPVHSKIHFQFSLHFTFLTNRG